MVDGNSQQSESRTSHLQEQRHTVIPENAIPGSPETRCSHCRYTSSSQLDMDCRPCEAVKQPSKSPREDTTRSSTSEEKAPLKAQARQNEIKLLAVAVAVAVAWVAKNISATMLPMNTVRKPDPGQWSAVASVPRIVMLVQLPFLPHRSVIIYIMFEEQAESNGAELRTGAKAGVAAARATGGSGSGSQVGLGRGDKSASACGLDSIGFDWIGLFNTRSGCTYLPSLAYPTVF
ncbi:hypothetical protein VTL71DRAFT_4098 [Oculimacula yallundae]|uniref:Uncharacterized protein n=1 Tax=Oculimacula yallundae TaxID=86028 RepID=A0ABR4C765_9HELO